MKGAPLPLKVTEKIDFGKAFGQHIAKQYGAEAWKNVEKTFLEMSSARAALDFSKMSAQLQNDFKLAAEFEGPVLSYCKYALLIDKYFSKDFNANKNLQCPYLWSNSFQPTKKTKAINSPKYEAASALYNLTVIYYTQGIYASAFTDQKERLKGIAKLQGALWCINEIKSLVPQIMTKGEEIPADLSLSYITLLGNYITGIAYSTLIDMLMVDASKTGNERLAIVNKAAAKYFQMAYGIMCNMKDCPLPEKETKFLRANLHYNYVIHNAEAMSRRSIKHIEKVDDEILAGHMGYAVSYLRIAMTDLDELVKSKKGGDLDYLSSEQKEELEKQYKLISSTYQNCEVRNKKVYKQTEFKPEQLPEIPEETNSVNAKQPTKFGEKIGCESLFDCFLSPEIIALKKELADMVNQKKVNIENTLRNFQAIKEKGYSESYVNYFLNLTSQVNSKKVEIPKELKAKIDKFRSYGGTKIYTITKESILDRGLQSGQQIEKIKTMLSKEKLDDDECRKTYPNKWNRAYSEQINTDYVFKIKGTYKLILLILCRTRAKVLHRSKR